MDWSLHLGRIFARLGEDATLTPVAGTAATVRGIYTAPYAVLPAGLDGGMPASIPRFAALTTDLGTVAQGDVLVCSGGTFNVAEVQPDAPGGFSVLQLEDA